MLFPLVEIFESVQGEGFFTGTPALFVRFAGCNLNCDWCDTDHDCKFTMNLEALAEEITKSPLQHIIFTGGEPTLYDLDALSREINGLTDQKRLHVETNGTRSVDWLSAIDYVTVSPKSPSYIQRHGFELKLVYTGNEDLNVYRRQSVFGHYYLQPCWRDGGANTQETYDRVMQEKGAWKLSLQTHKMIGIR